MHFVVVGAGAIGTLFGALVWSGGAARVTLVAREPHARAINQHGILITRAGDGERRLFGRDLMAVTELAQVAGPIDYLLIAVKRTDLEPILARLGAIRSQVDCVFSLQNGIDHDDILRRAFGPERVIGALTMEGAAMPGPGVIDHLLTSTTYVGEFSGEPSTRTALLAAELTRGTLHTVVIDGIGAAKWTKFVQSCAASGLCGVTRLGYAPATRSLGGATLYVELIREGVSVMRAQGLEPATIFTDAAQVRTIGGLPQDQAVTLVRRLAEELIQKGYTGSTSLARDLDRGRPTEVEALMGTMHRAGRELGVATPHTTAVYLAIKAADEAVSNRGMPIGPSR